MSQVRRGNNVVKGPTIPSLREERKKERKKKGKKEEKKERRKKGKKERYTESLLATPPKRSVVGSEGTRDNLLSPLVSVIYRIGNKKK